MRSIFPNRILSVVLALVFFTANGLFAYSSESNLWAERRKAARRLSAPQFASTPGWLKGNAPLVSHLPVVDKVTLSSCVAKSVPPAFLKDHATLFSALSPAHGTVRKVTLGKKGGPVIVHIQDVHMNREAQWNIRHTVRSLLEAKQVDLLALEGSTEEMELQPFVDFPHRQAVEITADYLLKENKISGPIHAALTAQGQLPRILGIDDPLHYKANVQAYIDSEPLQGKARDEIKTQLSALSAEKAKIYSPALLEFDKQVQAYRSGTTSLAIHICSLHNVTLSRRSGTGLDGNQVPSFQHVSLFQKALTLEKTLDFKQVEHERAQMIDRLVEKLTPQQTQSLLAQSVAYRSGQLRYTDFYQELKALCQKADIRLSDYPAMDDYVKYVLLADGIDAERLMEELENLEKTAFSSLAKTAAEKSLIAEDRHIWLTGKLVDFALTPKEWEDLHNSSTPINSLLNSPRLSDTVLAGTRKSSSPKNDQATPVKTDPVTRLPAIQRLDSFRSFYQEAKARDKAMAQHLLEASNSVSSTPHRPVTLALVTGGFHAPGLTDVLTKAGATVISFVPKIEKVDTAQGSAYLSARAKITLHFQLGIIV
ncbi:MAG: hypothetical protein IPN19_15145 [Elusimicrobia bacterium]|nr:hypothetical protein [Elusimicrobiota bacterium]